MDSHDKAPCAQNAEAERAAAIARLNDRLREKGRGGKICVTAGICSLTQGVMPAVIRAVAEFTDFTQDNDPYGEHDFGALTVLGHRVNWKVDYYDRHMKFGSPDPTDSSVTTRVLTIMLASEY